MARAPATGKPLRKMRKTQTCTIGDELIIEDVSATTIPPVRKKAKVGVNFVDVDLSNHTKLQGIFDKPTHEFRPKLPKDTEVAIGFWRPDPDPQRLVTVEIQKTGELGFFIRNMTRTGRGVEPSDEYEKESDRMFEMGWVEVENSVDRHSKCRRELDNASAQQLMDYVFANTKNKESLLPWYSGGDVTSSAGLGHIYQFLSREPTREEAIQMFGLGCDDPKILFLRCVGWVCQMEKAATQAVSCSEKASEIFARGDMAKKEKAEQMSKVFEELAKIACKPLEWVLRSRATRCDSVEITKRVFDALPQAIKDDFRCTPAEAGPPWILKKPPRILERPQGRTLTSDPRLKGRLIDRIGQ